TARRVLLKLNSYLQALEVGLEYDSKSMLGSNVRFGNQSCLVNLGTKEQVRIGDQTVCRGLIRVGDFGPAQMSIGKRTYIGDDVLISCTKAITIGDDVLIAHGVQIFDNDSHPLEAQARSLDWARVNGLETGARTGTRSGHITIGNKAWICTNAI